MPPVARLHSLGLQRHTDFARAHALLPQPADGFHRPLFVGDRQQVYAVFRQPVPVGNRPADAFGQPTMSSYVSGWADNPFLFQTMYFDSITGMYYDKARWYSPTVGRFMTRDPIAENGDVNIYAYGHNDPGNRYDAWGRDDAPNSESSLLLKVTHGSSLGNVTRVAAQTASPLHSCLICHNPEVMTGQAQFWDLPSGPSSGHKIG